MGSMVSMGDKRMIDGDSVSLVSWANRRDADQGSGNQAVREIKNNTTPSIITFGLGTAPAHGTRTWTHGQKGRELGSKRKGSLEGDGGLGC